MEEISRQAMPEMKRGKDKEIGQARWKDEIVHKQESAKRKLGKLEKEYAK